ncbi:Spo0E family sporulation regulatory protein-aspartic acid phosphatase [Metabacillus halosaccharovorans]|uniref:aspartyl-phosphate phosphatase Spo0E family protein n=1 Tax=Metabacillus halosaccharovorans TaxID=930124 RepID=UPI00203F40E7|nr:aspartyl-phosphate phosphatase Spo0E family protein [Metabacillus halosaccharovorans]MCM3443634.1 aspartyl-phosphate phosphatase Spo0E family protein [Metabacillus halosaccharovorans]
MEVNELYDSSGILEDIELLRRELIESGLKSGFNSEETIKVSQILDGVINQYLLSKW